jgi:hypothetical protein
MFALLQCGQHRVQQVSLCSMPQVKMRDDTVLIQSPDRADSFAKCFGKFLLGQYYAAAGARMPFAFGTCFAIARRSARHNFTSVVIHKFMPFVLGHTSCPYSAKGGALRHVMDDLCCSGYNYDSLLATYVNLYVLPCATQCASSLLPSRGGTAGCELSSPAFLRSWLARRTR